MMFWKFQTQRSDATEQAPGPVFVPATPPAPPQQPVAPQPPPVAPPAPEPPPVPQFAAPAPVAPAPVTPAPVAPALEPTPTPPPSVPTFAVPPQAPAGYEQAAERTMRFLADALGIPSWVLFKNQSGTLSVVTGSGDYLRYLPSRELSIGRLSDLQTINVLAAAPPISANGGVDRRQGGVDPSTVAPFGVPLVDADGNLFGILCALGERSAAQRAAQTRPLLDYAASMLGAVVRTELTLEEATRRTERAQADALVDPLTGLHNRRAWDQLLATEDQRCSRHGYDAVVFVIDLDGLKATNDRYGHEKGDELIKNAATALERCVRRTDVVARVGGDEFSILAVKCDANAAARIREHIESTLMRANAPATVGFAVRSEAGDLFEAWRQADGAMYHRKRGNPRRGQRATDENVMHAAAAPAPQPPAPQPPAPQPVPEPQTPEVSIPAPAPPVAREPEPKPAGPPAVETSVVTQILEKVLPALVTGIQKAAPPSPPPPPPTPIFAAPQPPPVATRPLIVPGEAEIPTYTPPPAPIAPPPPAPPIVAAPDPEPAIVSEPQPAAPVEPIAPVEPATPQPEPQAQAPAPSQPSEDLIDIVSRLSRLSDSDRRLLDVFFKGSR